MRDTPLRVSRYAPLIDFFKALIKLETNSNKLEKHLPFGKNAEKQARFVVEKLQ